MLIPVGGGRVRRDDWTLDANLLLHLPFCLGYRPLSECLSGAGAVAGRSLLPWVLVDVATGGL
jgi:hypothetical protein